MRAKIRFDWKLYDFEQIRQEKVEKHGAFWDKLLLIEVIEDLECKR